MSIDISLDMDVKALLKQIDKLQHKDAKEMKRDALRAAGNVVRDAMREEVNRLPMSSSGKTRFKRAIKPVFGKRFKYYDKVAVGAVYKGQKSIAPDAHLFELGTTERFTKKGLSRGRIKATPFMRPGWERSKGEALKKMQSVLSEKFNQHFK